MERLRLSSSFVIAGVGHLKRNPQRYLIYQPIIFHFITLKKWRLVHPWTDEWILVYIWLGDNTNYRIPTATTLEYKGLVIVFRRLISTSVCFRSKTSSTSHQLRWYKYPVMISRGRRIKTQSQLNISCTVAPQRLGGIRPGHCTDPWRLWCWW